MTGSNFSIGYRAERGDGNAFVKVLDISKASITEDPARTLQDLTTAFNFERDVLEKCQQLSRVVSALAEGTVTENLGDRVDVAQYIIFELAESDLRKQILSRSFDLALNLRALHHVATGLSQLHSKGIAHQDIKPSNILIFNDTESKIGDLGRSSTNANVGPHDELSIAGDPVYAPPELIYGHVSSDWNIRRRACDLYQLGSLVVSTFTGVGMTSEMLRKTHPNHRPYAWSGFYSELVGYLDEYFRVALESVTSRFPDQFRDDLKLVTMQLCCPDPEKRGHPKNHARQDPYGLQRYVSLFNRLALKAEIDLKRTLR